MKAHFPVDLRWLTRMADLEDKYVVTAGDMREDSPSLRAVHTEAQAGSGSSSEATAWEGTRRLVFGKLINLRRREKKISVESLASKLSVSPFALVGVEQGTWPEMEPRVVYRLAKELGLRVERLLVLAGLADEKDKEVCSAAVRFAANSDNIGNLTDGERAALDEFVRVLNEG